jgi:hypothetical protein
MMLENLETLRNSRREKEENIMSIQGQLQKPIISSK